MTLNVPASLLVKGAFDNALKYFYGTFVEIPEI